VRIKFRERIVVMRALIFADSARDLFGR